MANYITAVEFTAITGITAAEAGETSSSATTVRDAEIASAQIEFIRDIRVFDGTEDDYVLAKDALGWLTGHKLAVRKMKMLGETNLVTMHLNEYRRLKSLLKKSEETDMAGRERIFDGMVDMITVEERYNEP